MKASLPSNGARYWGTVLLVAAVYFLTAKLGMLLASVQGNVTLFWPPAGIGLAALILGGWRLLPAVALGTWAATATTGASWPLMLAAVLGNSAAGLAGLGLLGWGKVDRRLGGVRDIMLLVLLGGLAASLVSASAGTLGLIWSNAIPRALWASPWLTWWLGDSIGVMTVTPLALYWAVRPFTSLRRLKPLELWGWAAAAAVAAIGLFGGWVQPHLTHMLVFVAFPLMLWAALRFGRRLTALCALVVCQSTVIATAAGIGPFAEHQIYGGQVVLWAYLASLTVTALALASATEQLRQAAVRLSHHRDELAQAVERRTAQLVSAHQELWQSHQRSQAILDSISDGFFTLDHDLVITYFNAAAERLVKRRAQEVLGLSFSQAFPEAVGSVLEEQYRRAVEEKIPLAFETFFEQEPYRNWFDVRIYPSESGASVFFRVTTAQKEAALALSRSEERLRTLVEESPLGVAVLSPEGKYLYINPQFTWIFGYTLEDIPQGREWFRRAFPDQAYRRQAIEAWTRGLASSSVGQVRPRTFQVTCNSGETKTVEFRPVTLSTGEQLVIYEDVSDREKALSALKASEEKFSKVFQHSPLWVVLSTLEEGRLLEVNQTFLQSTGFTREEATGRTILELGVIPDDRGRRKVVDALLRHGAVSGMEVRMRTKTGRLRHMLYYGTLIQVGGQRLVLSLLQDITERKRAEEALRASEEKFQKLYMASPVWVNLTTLREGRYLEVNDAFCQVTGYSRQEAIGKTSVELGLWENPADRRTVRELILRNGSLRHFPINFRMKDGRVRQFLWSAEMAALGPEPVIISAHLDITDLRQAQEALAQSEEQYRLLVNHLQDAVYILQDNRFVFANPEVEHITGYSAEELRDLDFQRLLHPDYRKEVAQRYQDPLAGRPAPESYPIRLVTKDGGERWIQVKGIAITWRERPALLYTARDITQQRSMEAQLRQSQKLEAVGTLAGGIAHDFNNLLAAVMGYAELSLDLAPPDGELVQNLEQILKAGARGRGLVQQMLSFSRGAEREMEPLDLAELIAETLKLLRPAIPSNIKIETRLEPCGPVRGDPVQLHQLMMNLITNAAQAMEESGGAISLSLERTQITLLEADHTPGLMTGPYVRLMVSDTGPGIPPELRERIFEPFFTTKEAGKGSGLGLAAVHGIVQSHLGAITLVERPGPGTTFQVLLPEAQEALPAVRPSEAPASPTGHERILFVDDEASLVEVGRNILERLGYRVRAFTSSREALQAFRADPQAFDLVITDQTMPGLTGSALTQEIKALRPDIPVIITTGFSHHLSPERASQLGVAAFVMKPITSKEIARMVRRALDEPPRPQAQGA